MKQQSDRWAMKNERGETCGHLHRTPLLAEWCPTQPDDSSPQPWPFRLGLVADFEQRTIQVIENLFRSIEGSVTGLAHLDPMTWAGLVLVVLVILGASER